MKKVGHEFLLEICVRFGWSQVGPIPSGVHMVCSTDPVSSCLSGVGSSGGEVADLSKVGTLFPRALFRAWFPHPQNDWGFPRKGESTR